MTAQNTRVPAPAMALQAQTARYREHLDEHGCEERRQCPQRDEIEDACDRAAFAMAQDRQLAAVSGICMSRDHGHTQSNTRANCAIKARQMAAAVGAR